MKLAVVGSRNYNNFKECKWWVESISPSTIISGGAKGADTMAKLVANALNLELIEYLPDWDTHGKSAGFIRNKTIVDNCDQLIAFWDGYSKGTKHSIDLAKKHNKLLFIVLSQ